MFLADLEQFSSNANILVVNGTLNEESLYAPKNVIENKRKQCADVIRALSLIRDLTDFFEQSLAEVYEIAQKRAARKAERNEAVNFQDQVKDRANIFESRRSSFNEHE